jgi:hypothetical protein
MYTVPSDAMAGLPYILLPVVKLHFMLPSVGFRAYSLSSPDPMYTVPSDAMAGLSIIQLPVVKLHFMLPLGFRAYSLKS